MVFHSFPYDWKILRPSSCYCTSTAYFHVCYNNFVGNPSILTWFRARIHILTNRKKKRIHNTLLNNVEKYGQSAAIVHLLPTFMFVMIILLGIRVYSRGLEQGWTDLHMKRKNEFMTYFLTMLQTTTNQLLLYIYSLFSCLLRQFC